MYTFISVQNDVLWELIDSDRTDMVVYKEEMIVNFVQLTFLR